MMNRRAFITGMAGGLLAAPLVVEAQPRAYRVGFLSSIPPDGSAGLLAAFSDGLRQHGYSERTNLTIEHRWIAGSQEGLDAWPASSSGARSI
jgi:hypothetical protein